jgi:DNA-binding MarR family transcriptional regulator
MAKKKTTSSKRKDPIEQELVAIKRLLVVLLYKLGSQQAEVASALQMDQADLSRMLPARKIKSIISSGR